MGVSFLWHVREHHPLEASITDLDNASLRSTIVTTNLTFNKWVHVFTNERSGHFADERARIPIESALGGGKRAFSLSRVMAKRADTAVTSIAMAVLVMNLDTLLRLAFLAVYSARLLLLACPEPSHHRQESQLLYAA